MWVCKCMYVCLWLCVCVSTPYLSQHSSGSPGGCRQASDSFQSSSDFPWGEPNCLVDHLKHQCLLHPAEPGAPAHNKVQIRGQEHRLALQWDKIAAWRGKGILTKEKTGLVLATSKPHCFLGGDYDDTDFCYFSCLFSQLSARAAICVCVCACLCVCVCVTYVCTSLCSVSILNTKVIRRLYPVTVYYGLAIWLLTHC